MDGQPDSGQPDSGLAAAGAPALRRTSGRPPQQRAIATRDGIASAAAEHFNTVGYAAASINEILTGTGHSKGALYHHFASKKALAQHLVHLWSTVLVETLSGVTDAEEPAVRQVVSIQRRLAAVIAQDHIARAGMLLSLEQAVDEHAKVYTAWTNAITVIIERAIQAGQLDRAAVQSRLGESLCAGFVGAVHVATSLGESDTISRRVDDLLTLWLGNNPTTVAAASGETP